jgi:hypothetical protein
MKVSEPNEMYDPYSYNSYRKNDPENFSLITKSEIIAEIPLTNYPILDRSKPHLG